VCRLYYTSEIEIIIVIDPQVNGIILENGTDRDVAAVTAGVGELQFEEEEEEAYYNKVLEEKQ